MSSNVERTDEKHESGYTLRRYTEAGVFVRGDLFAPSGWRVGIYKTDAGMTRALARHLADDRTTAGYVSIDGNFKHLAQYDPTSRWNGWLAAPHFDALTVVAILTAIDDDEYGYDWGFDDDGTLVVSSRVYAAEDVDYEPERYKPDADGLYCVGAYGWCWYEDALVCVNAEHDHETNVDDERFIDSRPESATGMLCNDCREPMHYEEGVDYVHDALDAVCFLIPVRPAGATDCVWE